MEVITHIPFQLDPDHIAGNMRIKPDSPGAIDFFALLKRAEKIGRPKALYKESYIEERTDDTVTIDGIIFTSRALRDNLEGINRVFPYIVTCGNEIDEADLTEGDFLKKFWLDCIKEELLKAGRLYLRDLLQKRYRLGKTSTMNPGSGDTVVWPIQQQKELFSLLGNVDDLIGVTLTDSFLMMPNKTVSGIRFPNEVGFESCELCHREDCPGRRADFNQELWEKMQNR
ncbi:MAG: vitamin B12 dependent-methionine synthase activation domain-containing protein [Spirochaetia bacterium]